MKIAVAYKDGEIFEHFGHAEMFALYDYPDMEVESCRKVLVECGDRHGHAAMAQLMKDNGVDAVIVGNIGAEGRAELLSMGIVPIAGYCGDADTAADMRDGSPLSTAAPAPADAAAAPAAITRTERTAAAAEPAVAEKRI